MPARGSATMALFDPSRDDEGRIRFMFARPRLPGEPEDEVYDGDGARGLFRATQSFRLLGCDAPEIAYNVPTGPDAAARQVKLGDPRWDAYLLDPFAEGAWPPFDAPLPAPVRDRLAEGAGPGAAANHARHADAARRALVDMMEGDRAALGQGPEDFRLFVVLAHEVFDGFGRMLAFVNAAVEHRDRRPPDYNARLLAGGWALPYFIWPNVDPFRGRPRLADAAQPPADLRRAARAGTLGRARADARAAREEGLGVLGGPDPLRLLPFELRMLGDRKAPHRWVVDLAAPDDDPTLLPPEDYLAVEAPEDRLFLPPEYVPLFEARGWRPLRPFEA